MRLRRRKKQADRLMRRARRQFERSYAQQGYTFTSAQLTRVAAAERLAWQQWERCRDTAIEIAAGIR